MEYFKQHKIVIFSSFFILILIGGVFMFANIGKNKKETKIPVVVNPITLVTSTTTPPSAPLLNQGGEGDGNSTTKIVLPSPPLPIGTDRFIVFLSDTSDAISSNLLNGGYITDATVFTNLIGKKTIAPGAYKISNTMTSSQLLQVLSGKPYMKWVLIPPGLRKEEIAALLAPVLGWTKKQTTEFITKDTTIKPEDVEGVYAPNTYLIPVGEKPADVATRLIDQFNENFASYLSQFSAKDIKWTSALTLASIVQREAANTTDMPLVAGILWNRLNQGMQLDVDSTLQYARGNTGSGWWAPITVADKKIDSPYNTYIHTGLPPHPICNPSIDAIVAVLNPTTTDCMYYLHDKNHVIHCAVTYAEQEANIAQYLSN
jgi:UPF0755 protein